MFTMAIAFGLPHRVIGAVPVNSATPMYDPAHRNLVPGNLRKIAAITKYAPGLPY